MDLAAAPGMYTLPEASEPISFVKSGPANSQRGRRLLPSYLSNPKTFVVPVLSSVCVTYTPCLSEDGDTCERVARNGVSVTSDAARSLQPDATARIPQAIASVRRSKP